MNSKSRTHCVALKSLKMRKWVSTTHSLFSFFTETKSSGRPDYFSKSGISGRSVEFRHKRLPLQTRWSRVAGHRTIGDEGFGLMPPSNRSHLQPDCAPVYKPFGLSSIPAVVRVLFWVEKNLGCFISVWVLVQPTAEKAKADQTRPRLRPISYSRKSL